MPESPGRTLDSITIFRLISQDRISYISQVEEINPASGLVGVDGFKYLTR